MRLQGRKQRITLHIPVSEYQTATAEHKKRFRDMVVSAVPKDRGGRESLQAETLIGEWTTVFWVSDRLEGLSTECRVTDKYQSDYSVKEVIHGEGRWMNHWGLKCVRA